MQPWITFIHLPVLTSRDSSAPNFRNPEPPRSRHGRWKVPLTMQVFWKQYKYKYNINNHDNNDNSNNDDDRNSNDSTFMV